MKGSGRLVRVQVFVGWHQCPDGDASGHPGEVFLPPDPENRAFGLMHRSETANGFRLLTTVRTYCNLPQEHE